MTHKEAIKWLELQSSIPIQWDDYSEKSAQVREEAERRIAEAFRMAINALKVGKPRVLTLGDLRDIGSVWELNTPPYLWMDINPAYRWTKGFWVAWRDIYEMIDGLHPTYNADNYGQIWRCWDKRPTEEQRKAVKWE